MTCETAPALYLDEDMTAVRARIDARLDRLVADDSPGGNCVHLAMREAVLAPGKRLRPLLTMLAARDLGNDSPAALDAGCAIELVHTASLILDDLPCMDDAVLRRGRPATHIAHGEDFAVLAAVALLAEAFGIAATTPTASATERAELVAILSAAVGVQGLVGGQGADLRASMPPSATEISDTNDRKTGSLFVAAVESAAVLAGTSPATRAILRDFGTELGRAFQILDDILDRDGTPDLLGKDVGKDAGRVTMMTVIGPDATRRRLAGHVDQAMAHLAALPQRPERLIALVCAIFPDTGPSRRHSATSAGAVRAMPVE